MSKSSDKFAYSGCGNLEAMSFARNYNNYLAKFVTDLVDSHPVKRAKVLDFGAGNGTFADILKHQGLTIDCLEPDVKLQKSLRSKGYKIQTDIKKCVGQYDIIYSFNVLEHIKDDQSIVKALKKALKPKGRLVIYVPAFQVLFSNMDKLVGHYRRYDRKGLKSLTEAAGLKNVSIKYCDPIGFFVSLIFMVVGSKDGSITGRSIKLYDKWIFPISNGLSIITNRWFGKNLICLAQNDK